MARKKYEPDEDNHERWLISYADFITLLFAFFVMMYSISSVNEGKYRILTNSLAGAFNSTVNHPQQQKSSPPENAIKLDPLPLIQKPKEQILAQERDKMKNVAKDVMNALEPLVKEGMVRVTQSSRGVTIEINASLLFAPGEASLNNDSIKALKAIANVLKVDNHVLQVEGHTDNLPIKNPIFPSNWELSAVRASTVARILTESGVNENRVTAIGQGAKLPIADNNSSDGRARNRRVEITMLAIVPDERVEIPVERPSTSASQAKTEPLIP